jgi:hypothetical protein
MKIIKVTYYLEKDYKDIMKTGNVTLHRGFRKGFVIREELLPENIRTLHNVNIYPMFSNKIVKEDKEGVTETITENTPILELKRRIEELRQEPIYIIDCIITDLEISVKELKEQEEEELTED